MTVCIASISKDNLILGIADRLVTATDIEFEPSFAKIFPFTTSTFLMTSDEDASLSAEIYHDCLNKVTQLVVNDPANWLNVALVVDMYLESRNEAKRKRAERDILLPLGLNSHTFISRQSEMNADFITAIANQLMNYRLPRVSSIICGMDKSGPHIYVIHDNDSECYDDIGFAAIGIGSSYANSQFMQYRHSRLSSTADTIFTTYLAKKRAEIAPGVGIEFDTC